MSRNFKIRLFVRGGKNARQVRFRLKLDQRHEKHSRVCNIIQGWQQYSHSVLKQKYRYLWTTDLIFLFFAINKTHFNL